MMMSRSPRLALFFSLASPVWASAPSGAGREEFFELKESAEVVANITASCHGCDWSLQGREAAVFRVAVDGRYSQHLFLTRGAETAEYSVMLGSLEAGRHTLSLASDSGAWSKASRSGSISRVIISPRPRPDPEHIAFAYAPILYARPNTVGRFTDVPLVMYYETEKTPRGSRIRYTVIFSNEDGGTPPDRLLATWGRLTDIEYVYGVELNEAGEVVEETFQGKDHEIVPFLGGREGLHPLLYVVTDNNMLAEHGTTEQRFAPAPRFADLTDASREKVMDDNPWTYTVSAKEARREGRVAAAPTPGSKRIFDPRRYAVVELCSASNDTTFATFTFALGLGGARGSTRFFDSTSGVSEFKISRSPDNFPNSCFRGAIALPKGARGYDLATLQVRAHARPPRKGEVAPARGAGPAHLRRVNRIVFMNESDLPEPSSFSWTGNAAMTLDGAPAIIEINPNRVTQK